MVRDKDGKELRSILDQEIEEGAEKKAEEAAGEHKAAFDFVKEALGDSVKEVKASQRLKWKVYSFKQGRRCYGRKRKGFDSFGCI